MPLKNQSISSRWSTIDHVQRFAYPLSLWSFCSEGKHQHPPLLFQMISSEVAYNSLSASVMIDSKCLFICGSFSLAISTPDTVRYHKSQKGKIFKTRSVVMIAKLMIRLLLIRINIRTKEPLRAPFIGQLYRQFFYRLRCSWFGKKLSKIWRTNRVPV